jgi:hypothetical protein
MYVYCIYSRYMLYRSVCPIMIESYTISYEVVNSRTPRKCTVLNTNFVLNLGDFDLRDVFQERNAGVQRDLHVERWQFQLLDTIFYTILQLCWW